MNTVSTILSWALALAPVPATPDATRPDDAPTVEASEYTSPAGHRTRWASASYLLPDGKVAEVFITADDTASGEAIISVDGEIIVSSSYDPATGVSSWTSPEPGAGELAAAALTAIADRGSGELLDAFIPVGPQEFPCSDYGEKVLKAGRYVLGALVIAGAAACCGVTSVVGCFGCHAAGLVAHEEGSDILDGYCD